MNKDRQKKCFRLVLALALFCAMAAQAAVWTWTNGDGDNAFTNAQNWDNGFPASETMVINLSGANKAIHSGGTTVNMDGMRIGFDSGTVGELEQEGGTLNATASSSRITNIGRSGGSGIWMKSGGDAFIDAIMLGEGSGSVGAITNSGGNLVITGIDSGRSLGMGFSGATAEFELSGGSLLTYSGISLGGGSPVGTSRFHINGAGGVVSNGHYSTASSGFWTQEGGSALAATVDSDDGFSLGQIVLFDGTNDNPYVTFQFGAILDVGFSGADMGDVTNSWDLITWPTNTVVTDNGLVLSTNTDSDVWGFSITNNALRITYGIGSTMETNTPPIGPRNLYWIGADGITDMTEGGNWVTNTSGGVAAWGLYEDDTVYIGNNLANPDGGAIYEATYEGGTPTAQSALYIGRARRGVLNFNSGELVFSKSTASKPHYIGFGASYAEGTLNMNGGDLSVYGIELGNESGAQGTINLNGGNLLLPGRVYRSGSGGLSDRATLWVGNRSGTGTVHVAGGSLATLVGTVLGNDGGVGMFSVEGSGASEIAIGGYRTDYDGFWVQNSGSTLRARIDDTATGITPIEVLEFNEQATIGDADVTFEAGSILDVGWMAGVTNYGVFDVMTFGGSITNKGLALAPGVDTNIWSFAIVDADDDGTNDTVRITAYGETSNGTSIPWLLEHGLTVADDEVDNDLDGLLTWEEYVTGTSPTNSASVLKVNSLTKVGSDIVITWQSVEGKSYSIITNLSLVSSNPGVAVSKIIGLPTETSYTSSVPAASSVFYEVGVE